LGFWIFGTVFISFFSQADIFGNDDRINPKSGSIEARLSQSVAVGVLHTLINEKRNGRFEINVDHLSDYMCKDERFVNEPSIGYACTGFLVSEDLLLTAGHCMTNHQETFREKELYCEVYKWVFDYKVDPLTGVAQTDRFHKNQIYSCAEIIYAVSNQDQPMKDFALIKLDRPVSSRKPLQISYKSPKLYEPVSMLGSPMGLPTKFTGNARVIQNHSSSNQFTTDLDAFSGNSGSPVFNSNYKVVGILIGGSPSDATYTDPVLRCERYNRCDSNGENCIASETDQLSGGIPNGSDVEKLSTYRGLLESFGVHDQKVNKAGANLFM
jgi:V8-like Glu-specific endopeptidase